MTKILKILSLSVLFLFVFLPYVSFGNNHTSTSTSEAVALQNPINTDSFPDFIAKVLEGIVKIGMPVIALAIVYSGFLYVVALGKPDKISEAHRAILYTLLGAVILLGAWGIAQVIVETVEGL